MTHQTPQLRPPLRLAALVAAMAAGCHAVEVPGPSATVQARPTAVSASSPPNQLDLGESLRLAGVNNPTINLAREAVHESLANRLAARSLLLPSVNVGGSFRSHRGAYQASFGEIRKVDAESLYLGAGAGTWGAGTVAVPGVWLSAHLGDAAYEPRAAGERVATRRADAHATENAVLLDVATAYLELVGAQARLTVLREAQTDIDEVARLTAAYAATGQGRRADADRAAATAELLRRDLGRAVEDAFVASARLCRLTNLDPADPVHTPGGAVEPIRLIPEDCDLEELVTRATQARPEVAARTAAIREAQAREKQERVRPWLPTLSAGYSGGGFGGGSGSSSPAFSPLGGRSDLDVVAVWGVQGLGFGNQARVRAAGAAVGTAVAEYDAAVNRVRREVAEAHADARAAASQIATATAAVAIAEEGFGLESQRIKQGQGLPIETLDSFRQLLDARQELVRAVIAFDVAQFRLFVAVGNTPAH